MNVCWIIPAEGEPHRRDIAFASDRESVANWKEYVITNTADDGSSRSASVFAERSASSAELMRAHQELFGDSGTMTADEVGGARRLP